KLSTLNVVYSSLSNYQTNKKKFLDNFNAIINPLIILTGAIVLIFLIFSENILYVLYGPKWLEAAFFMKALSLGSFFFLLEMFNRTIFKVFDVTQKILLLEIIKKSI